MAIAFMAFFSIIVAEYINAELARKIFLPLLLLGVAAVLYWYYTETQQRGDLRLYILVQFLPMVLIPYILLTHKSAYTHGHYYWLVIASYALAKLLEQGDALVFDNVVVISGHSLKHLASALAPLFIYQALRNRQCINHPTVQVFNEATP